jgi:hypothetical protein
MYGVKSVIGQPLPTMLKRAGENLLTAIFLLTFISVFCSFQYVNLLDVNDVYSLPNIVRVVKSRRTRWAGHVARMGEGRGVHMVLVETPEGRRPTGRPLDVDGRIILRWILRKWEGVVGTGWSGLRIGTGGGNL